MHNNPTFDEILIALPGEELDSWVAEFVMDFEWKPMSNGWYREKDQIFIPVERWNPSVDSSCAKEVVEYTGITRISSFSPVNICKNALFSKMRI